MKSVSNAGHFDLEGEREEKVELKMSWKEESQVLNSEEHNQLTKQAEKQQQRGLRSNSMSVKYKKNQTAPLF